MLLYPCDQTAKNSSWRDNCPAQSHPTKKEGQSSQLGITIRSFSDCQRRGLARCDHVGRSIRDLPWTPSEQGGASRAPPLPTPNTFLYSFSQKSLIYWLQAVCHALFSCGNVAYVLVKEDRQTNEKVKCRQTSEILWVPDSLWLSKKSNKASHVRFLVSQCI